MSGERECATGWPQTNARGKLSGIDHLQFTELSQEGQQWQSDDGKIIAINLFEELYPFAFHLISANALQCYVAHPRKMAPDEVRLQLSHRHARYGDVTPYGFATLGQNHSAV